MIKLLKMRSKRAFATAVGMALAFSAAGALAQNESGGVDAGTCSLRDHSYTCDGAKFHLALESAQTVGVQVHNSDGVSRVLLTDFVKNKLNKTVAQPGTQADLIFLIIPVDNTGVMDGAVSSNLGTLRVYSSTQDGRPEHLVWADTYRGMTDLPWPAVVHRLIDQFQKQFRIK